MNKENFHVTFNHFLPTPKDNFCSNCGSSNLEMQKVSGRDRQVCMDCKKVIYKNPKVGIGVMVVNYKGAVLLGKINKPNNKFHKKWTFINGFVEYDQSFIDAAYAEVMEESGLEIELESLIGLVSTDVPTLAPILKAKALTEKISPQDDEMSEFMWFKNTQAIPDMGFIREEIILKSFFDGTLQEWNIDLTPY